jgi:glycosyltransferase involved in cell wall biosynthesis
MRVLALSSYPIEAASTRFRIAQFIEPLGEMGTQLELSSFLNSEQFGKFYAPGSSAVKAAGMIRPLLKRIAETMSARRYDAIFLQREAMFFGPAVFEWLIQKTAGLPLILDLDDATYVRYESPRFGKFASAFKFFGKTDRLIERADAVVCGNRFIAEYVSSHGSRSVVIPTVADTEIFKPADKNNDVPVIGWIGTHSTFPFLEKIFPVLERLSKEHDFCLKVVGSGKDTVSVEDLTVENLRWELSREVEDLRSFDIGLYPITVSDSANREWLLGKSGFKSIQYLAVGIPFVVSPVGVAAEIGIDGTTHFSAKTDEDWYNSLDKLLSDIELRSKMGKAGRQFSLKNYTVPKQAEKLAETFLNVLEGRKR